MGMVDGGGRTTCMTGAGFTILPIDEDTELVRLTTGEGRTVGYNGTKYINLQVNMNFYKSIKSLISTEKRNYFLKRNKF
jgi:hypothetical protein